MWVDIIIVSILIVVLISLIAHYLITSIKEKMDEEVSLNKEVYNQFRTLCIQSIIRAISIGFCVGAQDIIADQNQIDWHCNQLDITFDDWVIWVHINWRTKYCKLTAMYERDDHKLFVYKYHFFIKHHIIQEAKLIKKLQYINSKVYLFAVPQANKRIEYAIKDAYSLSSNQDIKDEALFNLMYNAWSRLPCRTKQQAEDFVRITSFLFRKHLTEMQEKAHKK